jgi:hypothetical protein
MQYMVSISNLDVHVKQVFCLITCVKRELFSDLGRGPVIFKTLLPPPLQNL